MEQTQRLKSLELEISNPCNERCVHCYRLCECTKHGFLSARDAENIFAQVKEFADERLSVVITGGEALLNKDWRAILLCAVQYSKQVSLFTNGSLMTRDDASFIATLVGRGLQQVQFSLYALDPAVHDSITKLPGSCEKTMNSILMLKDAHVPVFVSCPAMQANKNVLADVMAWADKNGIPSCCDLMIFGASDYSGSNLSERLTPSDLESFYHVTMKNNGALSYVWGRPRDQIPPSEVLFYSGAVSNLCISGDGTIYPMIGWYQKIGSLAADNLRDVFYDSDLLQRIRKIKVSDFSDCVSCAAYDRCTFCASPHLTANHGELLKRDTAFCDYVRLVKQYSLRRDKEFSAADEKRTV